jgi:hypothetical protein
LRSPFRVRGGIVGKQEVELNPAPSAQLLQNRRVSNPQAPLGQDKPAASWTP